jgi:hypothetical protein
MEETLDEYRNIIKEEARYIDKKPYSHNIVSMTLACISKTYGDEEVKKAIRDFGLDKKGWGGYLD